MRVGLPTATTGSDGSHAAAAAGCGFAEGAFAEHWSCALRLRCRARASTLCGPAARMLTRIAGVEIVFGHWCGLYSKPYIRFVSVLVLCAAGVFVGW